MTMIFFKNHCKSFRCYSVFVYLAALNRLEVNIPDVKVDENKCLTESVVTVQ